MLLSEKNVKTDYKRLMSRFIRLQISLIALFLFAGSILCFRIEILTVAYFAVDSSIHCINELEVFENSKLYAKNRIDWKKHKLVGLNCDQVRSIEGEPDALIVRDLSMRAWMPDADSMWTYNESINTFIFFRDKKCIGVRDWNSPWIFDSSNAGVSTTKRLLIITQENLLDLIRKERFSGQPINESETRIKS